MSSKTKTTATKEEATPALVPKLRFPEFRDAEGWAVKPFDELFTVGNGRDYKHLEAGDVPVYGSGGYMLSVNDYLYDGESVCIGRKGTINNPMFLTGRFWTVDTLFYTHSFKECLPKFIFAIFQQIDWLKHNEAGGVPSLSKTNIQKIQTAVPKPAEQQKIAECLSSVDELIAAQARKLDALKTHKRGLMQQLFPREGETQPRLRFPEFKNAGEWEVKTIGDLKPFVTSGSRGWAPFYSEHGELFVRITNLWRDSIYLDLTDAKFVQLPPGVNEGVRTQLKEHDVLISITADIGVIGYVDESVPSPAYINQHIALVRFDANQLCGKYVAYFLASEKSQRLFRASTDTGTKAGMSLIGIQKIELMLPGLSEQQRIADCLTSLDNLIAAQTQKHEALKIHKKGLMQQLFPSPVEVGA
jgi:type I restriction enzyme S subunit